MTISNAARLGDRSNAPSDVHSCGSCAHSVTGPAFRGSGNVLINDRCAVRKGDIGAHAKCCGANRWKAIAGAAHVLINNQPVHRLGDSTLHCGGAGRSIDGSPNVLVGDLTTTPKRRFVDVGFRLVDGLGRPIAGQKAEVRGPNGWQQSAQTDQDGRIIFRGVPDGVYTLFVAGRQVVSKSLQPMR